MQIYQKINVNPLCTSNPLLLTIQLRSVPNEQLINVYDLHQHQNQALKEIEIKLRRRITRKTKQWYWKKVEWIQATEDEITHCSSSWEERQRESLKPNKHCYETLISPMSNNKTWTNPATLIMPDKRYFKKSDLKTNWKRNRVEINSDRTA